MSCFSLQEKLIPASRAWKGFTSTLQAKLTKLKQSKPIKNTRKQLNTLYAIFLNRRQASHVQRPLHQSFPPVYVDDLFVEPTKSKTGGKGEPSATTSKGTGSSAALRLPLWEVDERADKFIAMFYEEMRLQRERSLGEYQEMLARGAM